MKTVWEYLSIRFEYVVSGLGIEPSQTLHTLIVNGQLSEKWVNENGRAVKTLPDFLKLVGEEGWELVGHAVSLNSVHDMTFKRPQSSS